MISGMKRGIIVVFCLAGFFAVDSAESLSFLPSDIGVFRGGSWFLDGNQNNAWNGCGYGINDKCKNFGLSSDVPVVGEWTGFQATAVGVFRSGKWLLDLDNNGLWDGCAAGDPPQPDGCYNFGISTDVPVAGHWHGFLSSVIGVFRNGKWYLDNGNNKWDGCIAEVGELGDDCYSFGLPGDVPVRGDWSGYGSDMIGVFRNGMWYLDYNGNGKWDGAADIIICIAPCPGSDAAYSFGLPGDVPVVGDWNGDGRDKIGVYRDGTWYLDYNANGKWDGCSVDRCYNFGLPSDRPVTGAWHWLY